MKIDIDEALRAYVDRPVPLGLEGRILRRVQRRVWVWPALGFAAAACCATGLWMVRAPVVRPAVRYPARTVLVRNDAAPVIPKSVPVRRKRRLQFEANALWRFSQEHPEAAYELTVVREPGPIPPLQIEPIFIEPLGELSNANDKDNRTDAGGYDVPGPDR